MERRWSWGVLITGSALGVTAALSWWLDDRVRVPLDGALAVVVCGFDGEKLFHFGDLGKKPLNFAGVRQWGESRAEFCALGGSYVVLEKGNNFVKF